MKGLVLGNGRSAKSQALPLDTAPLSPYSVMTDSGLLILTRPWSGAMLALSIVSFVYSLWQRLRATQGDAAKAEKAEEEIEFGSQPDGKHPFRGEKMKFNELFKSPKPLIGCIHLLALPGSPRYSGLMREVYDTALSEVETFTRHPIDGLIVENFRDKPFFPDKIPAETIAALAALTREVVKAARIPVGVNALRNDPQAAVAIATAAEAHFIRVNVHMSAVLSEQGIIQGASHHTLRLRAALRSGVLIFADVGVKHAAPLADRGLAIETKDLADRGLADAIIVSGELTGAETKMEDVDIVRRNTDLPILIGSGAAPENLHKVYSKVDGFIVGSYFKKDGKADNLIDERRVKTFTDALTKQRKRRKRG